jgi:tetratricopeptide (TPR) repeat protein
MASVEPYSPCPCGSGQKFKWCCQKVETYAERAQRMVENGQYEAALKPLSEGLAKYPDNPWLLTRKALIEIQLKQIEPAKASLRALLKKDPGHLGGNILMIRLELETEGPPAAAAQFQQGLSAMAAEQRRSLAPLALFLGVSLCRSGFPIAGFKHLDLVPHWGVAFDESNARAIASLRSNAAFSPWEKNPYRLWPPPEGVTDAFRESFERAVGWAEEGLWASAASAFELLAAGSSAGAIADRNRGICCLWIADHDGAVAALRRYIARTGPSAETVDLEALCQRIATVPIGDPVEFVHLTWPIRNREGLIEALRTDPAFEQGPNRPLHPDDPDTSATERFFMLDRKKIEGKPGLNRRDIPVVEGEVIVGQDTVVLETYDDGRLDRLSDRFTAAARANIPPAHPRTKVVEKESRHQLAMTWRWSMPHGVPEVDVERLNREQRAYIIGEIWPTTPQPALRGRSPLQASKAGDSETVLRATIRLLESTNEDLPELLDWGQLRARLGLKPEPAVEPEGLDLDRLHMSRWSMIPGAALDDDRLLAVYLHARQWGLRTAMLRAAAAIADRPSLAVKGRIPPTTLYADLVLDAARQGKRAEAEDWLRRGRQSEPSKISSNALIWELIDLQVKIILDEPAVWVPTIAVLFERYRGNREAISAVLLRLMEMGLVRPVADPKNPEQIGLDTRILDQLLAEYGPRVTTASGDLGVSAGRGEIWTPEASRGGSAIWTPGSEAATAPGQERPKLIVPGQ